MNQFSENVLWKQNPELQRLSVLNPTDFKAPFINKDFFPGTLGLADQGEIIARNEIVRFLFNNPKIGGEIHGMFSEVFISNNGLKKLPSEGNNFLAFYQKENAYWNLVDLFVLKLKNKTNSQRLIDFIEQLEKDKARLFDEEKEMGKRISETLGRVTEMQGFLEFKLDNSEVVNEVIIGQKSFNAKWSPSYTGNIPEWAKAWIFRVIGIQTLIQKLSNEKLRKKSYRSALILNFPSELKEDIISGARERIFEKKWQLTTKGDKNILTESEKDILKFLENIPPLTISLEFKYDKKGLVIHFLDIKAYKEGSEDEYTNTGLRGYVGHTKQEKAQLTEQIHNYEKVLKDTVASKKALKIITFLENNCGLNFLEKFKIKSAQTDCVFSWDFLENIYDLPENKVISADLNQQREFFYEGLLELMTIDKMISDMKSQAKSKGMPICLPEVITDKVGINFKNLAPINMISQDKKMVPFSFPELNGRMICLTGRHGRGKSVAGNSVLETLWLAQSGLPVFAESFSFDVKDVIGAVINDEGHGSTATVFVQKTKNLLENIAKVPSEKSVIFIDEIGKGTQENAGLVLGKRLLDTMSKKHYSVIFNTQIMDLARYAEQTVQAKCLKVNKNHQFAAGIGEGEMEELVKEIGLDKYLN